LRVKKVFWTEGEEKERGLLGRNTGQGRGVRAYRKECDRERSCSNFDKRGKKSVQIPGAITEKAQRVSSRLREGLNGKLYKERGCNKERGRIKILRGENKKEQNRSNRSVK